MQALHGCSLGQCQIVFLQFLALTKHTQGLYIGEEWFESVKRAAMDGETVEGELVNTTDGKRFRFTARQIIYPGYCAITYQEL